MAEGKPRTIQKQIVGLAALLPETQQQLDGVYDRSVRELAERLRESELDASLAQYLLPPRILTRSYRIEIHVSLSNTRESSFRVGAGLAGTPICAFYASRYGVTKEQGNRLSIEVESKTLSEPEKHRKGDRDG